MTWRFAADGRYRRAIQIEDGYGETLIGNGPASNRQAFATRAVHGGGGPDASTGAVTVPIFATSTYAQESPGVHPGYEYARTRNPTREALERCVADLENGASGFAFASGSAAVATMVEYLDQGSHVIATDDLYGGTLATREFGTSYIRPARQVVTPHVHSVLPHLNLPRETY